MGYDPKRPRPSVASESQVDALIEPVAPKVEPLAVVPPAPAQAPESVGQAPGTADRPAVPSTDRQPTPVVPAPAEGTANRAVVGAVVAVVAALVAVVVLLRRRRQG